MDKVKEKGILKTEPRPKLVKSPCELTPQGSWENAPSSPHPSVDRLSVTWADLGPDGGPDQPRAMASASPSAASDNSPNYEVKFSPAGDGSEEEDEDYSVSLNAVLRQRRASSVRRASVRRGRRGGGRRASSPMLAAEPRRRSSVFTTSSGDTAISMEDLPSAVVTQEQIFENIHLHKEVLGSVKQQPLGMRRKLKIVHQAKAYIKRHEGQLQERLAQSKSTRDIYARFNILLATKWQQMKREAANTSNLLIPWELRIKEIESHFGSVVASYFTFLRWLFWVNLVIGFILLVFVIVPECLTANPDQDGERKKIMEDEKRNSTNLLMIWEFEGVLKFSPIFYGYYSNIERPEYKMPLAYFLTGLVVYIYSFVAILKKMAENSRMSKLSEKEDECIFSWKLFTGWDFMIGNTETADNRIASIILSFKEALLEEAEKKKNLRNWRIVTLRAVVNIGVVFLLAVSAYAVITVVSHSDDNSKERSWWRENETTIVVTVISITFPVFFELLGFLEHYHPRKQLRLQLARIMLLNLLNLYSLIFALFSKIDGMGKELIALKPTLYMNASTIDQRAMTLNETLALTCLEISIPCVSCNVPLTIHANRKEMSIENSIKSIKTAAINKDALYKELLGSSTLKVGTMSTQPYHFTTTLTTNKFSTRKKEQAPLNLKDNDMSVATTTENIVKLMNEEVEKELEKMKRILPSSSNETSEEIDESGEGDVNYDIYGLSSEYSESTMSSFVYTLSTENSSPSPDYQPKMSSFNNTDSTLDVSYTFTTSPTNFDSASTDSVTADITVDSSDSSSRDTAFSTETVSSTDTLSSTVEVSSAYSTNGYYPLSSSYGTSTNEYASNEEAEITPPDSGLNTKSTEVYKFPDSTYSTEKVNAETTNYPTVEYSEVSRVVYICPNITFNCTVNCAGRNVTQVVKITNCTTVEKKCYVKECRLSKLQANSTIDFIYEDKFKRKIYNLTKDTKKKLLKLCWETMFGQELVKLTMMDLVFVLLGTLFMDFFRALFVRYMNRCWCWDLEKKFPEYGDFKIAENILHLINNQGMVWMGMFFSPGLVVLNVSKLMIMMYLRSWAVMTCNVPHEVVFRVSKSNNFYLALLLTMLFLCVLPVGYTIVCVRPSWHCGPFSEYEKIYYILTTNIRNVFPRSLNFILEEYIASPAIVIPMLVLLILIIYYLTSLTNSLREANNDLKIQLRRERTEERRKMFQLADTRRRGGASMDTPFARWKKALPTLGKSIDSDDRKTATADENSEPPKAVKKKGNIFAKIVGMALDKKSNGAESVTQNVTVPKDDDISHLSNTQDDETDTDFHESLPKEVLKLKDITIIRRDDHKKRNNAQTKTDVIYDSEKGGLDVVPDTRDDLEIQSFSKRVHPAVTKKRDSENDSYEVEHDKMVKGRGIGEKQTSESSTQSKQDSIGSNIPVITISTTESDDEILHGKKLKEDKNKEKKQREHDKSSTTIDKSAKKSELKSLRRQSSVESASEQKPERKPGDGHKFQYSL